MRIASWNLNHRTIEKPIPEDVIRFLSELDADVVSMNEYVDGPTRSAFKIKLNEAGYTHHGVSPRISNNNQIFIASKHPFRIGDLAPPSLSDSSITNFLHVEFLDNQLELIGFRAPAYKLSSERVAYWQQFGEIIRSSSTRRIVIAGDLNYDPFSGPAILADSITLGSDEKFTIPNPKGDWSYISIDGKNTSRIDHVIASEEIRIFSAKYLTEWRGIQLAGSKDMAAITDHAVLLFDVDA